VDKLVRTSVKVGVAYGSPAKKVAALIMQAAVEQVEVLKDPQPLVIFDDFGDNSLVFEVSYWIESTADGGMRVTRSNIRFRLDELFEEHHIIVAFPQRDVHLDGSITVVNSKS
jgi:small-conductance mechanosensitive channel